jgi:hypothetical protein
MRAAVYAISPTAAKLKPFLESPNDPLKAVDCQSVVHICDESGGWFPYDLLTAAASTGEIHSVFEVQLFFSRIADDIARACSDGKLHCSTSPVLGTGLPPLNDISLTAVLSNTAHGLQDMVWDRVPIAIVPNIATSRAEYEIWSAVVSAMPSYRSVTQPARWNRVYPALQMVDVLYGIGNLTLVALGTAGASVFALSRRRGRPRREDSTPGCAAIAGALLVGPLVGMSALGLFQAAQGLRYVVPIYWTDFSTPLELALVVGGMSGWRSLRQRGHERSLTEGP